MAETIKKYAVIILAAGFSSRMEDFKPLLPFGGTLAIVKLIKSAKMAGIDDITVVAGYGAEKLLPAIEAENIKMIVNDDFEQGMYTSVCTGVSSLQPSTEAFFVLPVDYPLVRPQVFLDLMDQYNKNQGAIIMPCYKGKNGHPPLIPSVLIPEILSYTGENGLKEILMRHQLKWVQLDSEFQEIIMDMDTGSDYQALSAHWAAMQTPDRETCLKLMEKYRTPTLAKAHCIAVARLALKIASELANKGINIDVNLVESAAMLHDMVRDRPNHASAGAEIARLYGMDQVAELIENHMYYEKKYSDGSITEQDILCLADKMVNEDNMVGLKERVKPILEKFKDNPEATLRIKERFEQTSRFEDQIKGITGKTMEEMWTEV